MQPFVNVYTRFARADGKTVWLHMDQWEGQNWKQSPGNIYGEPVRVHVRSARRRRRFASTADKVIPPIQPPPDTALVKRIKIQSAILSKWWGHPIHLGRHGPAAEGLRRASRRALSGQLRAGALLAARARRIRQRGAFDTFWLAPATPRMIYVTLQHPSPYYDDSYGVNSENNGPYGDAIMQELIPGGRSRSSA